MSLFLRSLAAALLTLAFTSLAEAQSARLRGTIASVNGDTFVVQTRGGDKATVRVKQPAKIGAVVKADLADIKPGLFVGAAAEPGPDGALKALEVHIFPEAMRGIGEGHRPFDRGPESTMTNAAIAGLVDTEHGKSVTLKYKNGDGSMGTFDVVIDPATPIVTFVPGDQSLLKPGAAIIAFARKNPDGTMTALAITAEKDGIKPPM
jgi:hypothetical protein